MRCSVLLSTFNQPNALALALEGYRAQTFREFEIIIADDGSDEETGRVIDKYRPLLGVRIERVWQENHGYRRAKIVDEAFKISKGEFLFLSDGDCIPAKDLLALHASKCRENTFCVGGYVMLTHAQSACMSPELVEHGIYMKWLTPEEKLKAQVRHMKNIVGIALGRTNKPKVFGCNIAVSRDAFEKVNGYDAGFDGFGKEDSDLRNRLRMAKVRPVSLFGKAWLFHIDSRIDQKIMATRIPRDKEKAKKYYYRSGVTAECKNGIKRLP